MTREELDALSVAVRTHGIKARRLPVSKRALPDDLLAQFPAAAEALAYTLYGAPYDHGSDHHRGRFETYIGARATSELIPVLKDRFLEFTKEAKRLQNKAAKLDCADVGFTVVGDGMTEVYVQSFDPTHGCMVDRAVPAPAIYVRVYGAAPRIEGWEFVARVESTPGESVVVATVPDFDGTVPEVFRDHDRVEWCDHCRTRRPRTYTYLVRHVETGEWKQVGRTCARDFLGGEDPRHVLARFEFLRRYRECMSPFGVWVDPGHDLRSVVALAAVHTRTHGFVSRRQADEYTGDGYLTTTAERVRDDLGALENPKDKRHRFVCDSLTDADWARADAALGWAREVDPGDNDYMRNLTTVCEGDLVAWRHIGIAVSVIAAHDRAIEREREDRARREAAAESRHVGEPGERMRGVHLHCYHQREMEGAYGLTTLCSMRDDDGNVIKWFATGAPAFDPGESFVADFTVKRHGEFRGALETTVNRLTVKG